MPAILNLGVNIDHVATLRQARGGTEPDVLDAARIAERAGAHGITMHLREDRRHIQDADLFAVRRAVRFLNMEMAVVPEIIKIALKVKPEICCLVPEKRRELTTEGGLDVKHNLTTIQETIANFKAAGIKVSLFIDPDEAQIAAAHEIGATHIELHTGEYANSAGAEQTAQWQRLAGATRQAQELGLIVNAGHGLNYDNVLALTKIPGLHELNIGHSIISRALLVGLEKAITEMLKLLLDR